MEAIRVGGEGSTEALFCTAFATKSGRRKSQINGERDFLLNCQQRRYRLLNSLLRGEQAGFRQDKRQTTPHVSP